MAEDYYAEIGVNRTADERTIKAKLDKLRKPFDKPARAGDADATRKLERYNLIQDALTDPETRALHDAELPEPVLLVEGDLYEHQSTYGGEFRSGFGRGRLTARREVSDGEVLTIGFPDGEKLIFSKHRGLTRVAG